MSVRYVKEFVKKGSEPVQISLDGTDVEVRFADGDLNTFGAFQPDGTFKLYELDDEFADRLESAGFTLESLRGEKYLKVTK